LSKVITLSDRNSTPSPRPVGIRDRRYTIRYPFAADAELIDMESGKMIDGVTSDLSLGGCFVCCSKQLPINARARMKLIRKNEVLEALVVVRIVKPRVGMGIEFFDLEQPNNQILAGWIELLRRTR
jgi:hypothetical protein